MFRLFSARVPQHLQGLGSGADSLPSRLAEYALAHKLGDEIEASYQRSTLFEKRRLLMQEWVNYLDLVESKVVRPHGQQ